MPDLLSGIPQNLLKFIPENVQQRSSFIKMKRLTEIDDSLLIINEEMSLNVSFTSPILETLQYLQQLEKYKLRAIFLSFPFTSKQFDQYYNQIQSLIMLKYKSNITNIMKILYELINVAGCEKINEMKMYTEMFSKIKDELLLNRSKTDVYGFNISQFDQDKQIRIQRRSQNFQKNISICIIIKHRSHKD